MREEVFIISDSKDEYLKWSLGKGPKPHTEKKKIYERPHGILKKKKKDGGQKHDDIFNR